MQLWVVNGHARMPFTSKNYLRDSGPLQYFKTLVKYCLDMRQERQLLFFWSPKVFIWHCVLDVVIDLQKLKKGAY
jgi:hypothetical protein